MAAASSAFFRMSASLPATFGNATNVISSSMIWRSCSARQEAIGVVWAARPAVAAIHRRLRARRNDRLARTGMGEV